MNNNFCLRKGNETDFDQLFSIYMNKSVNRYLNFEIMDKHEFSNIFNELLKSGQLYVFEDSKQIMATCIVMRQKRRANHVVSLGTLATHPEYQGQRIGTQFLRTLFKELTDDGIKRVDLCVEADNSIAQKFYQKLGFQLEGVLKRYFKRPNEDYYVDEHMMALLLS